MSLTAQEKFEVALIPLAVLGVGAVSSMLPSRLTVGELIAVGCLSWLVQGGIRDVAHLVAQRRKASGGAPRKLPCMCFESSVGFVGLIVGLVLVLTGYGDALKMTPFRWMVLAAVVFNLGFFAKDLVISWHPLALRRDPNHQSIVFSWW
jgi:hypothetical protein